MYDLKEKKLQLLKEGNIFQLYINYKGIYYNELDNDYIEGFHMDHMTNKIEEVDFIYGPSYYEYQIQVYSKGIRLVNMESKEQIQLAPQVYMAYNPRLSDEYLSFNNEQYIYVLNLLTGERHIIDLNQHLEKPRDHVHVLDYIIINNMVYATIGPVIIVNSLDNDVQEEYFGSEYLSDGYNLITALYTDGEDIYATTSSQYETKLYQLIFRIDDMQNDIYRRVFERKAIGE